MEAAVDDVEAVGDAAVAGKGEHHAGVGSLETVSVGQSSRCDRMRRFLK